MTIEKMTRFEVEGLVGSKPIASKRSAVVTGGGSGIGRAIVEQLAREQVQIVALDIDAEALATLADEDRTGRITVLRGDVRDAATLESAASAAEELGCFAGWVNNAASFAAGALHDTPMEEVRASLAVNLDAAVVGSAIAVRRFLANGTAGSIVNVSSIHARLAFPGWLAYGMAKSGLEGLTRSTAVEYGRCGIRANAVAPGAIATDGFREDLARRGSEGKTRMLRIAARHALGRFGEPAEVAAVVVFLLSDAASFITGAVVPVDGGYSVYSDDA